MRSQPLRVTTHIFTSRVQKTLVLGRWKAFYGNSFPSVFLGGGDDTRNNLLVLCHKRSFVRSFLQHCRPFSRLFERCIWFSRTWMGEGRMLCLCLITPLYSHCLFEIKIRSVEVCSMFLHSAVFQRESEIRTVGGLASSCLVLVLTGFSSREAGLLSRAQLASWLTLIWCCLSVTALYGGASLPFCNLEHNCLPSIEAKKPAGEQEGMCGIVRFTAFLAEFWKSELMRGSSKLE